MCCGIFFSLRAGLNVWRKFISLLSSDLTKQIDNERGCPDDSPAGDPQLSPWVNTGPVLHIICVPDEPLVNVLLTYF